MSDQNAFLWILLFAFGAMLVNSVGIYVIWKNSRWAMKVLEYFMCFAAGMLIASPLIMAFPNAIAKNGSAGIAALTGFVFMFMSNRLIKKRTRTKELAFGITAIQGILIHSLLDGVIYTVTFSVSTMTGVLTGIGLVVHEFAEGVVTFSVLLKSGMSSKKSALYAFFAADYPHRRADRLSRHFPGERLPAGPCAGFHIRCAHLCFGLPPSAGGGRA